MADEAKQESAAQKKGGGGMKLIIMAAVVVLVAAGERLAVDGVVSEGVSDIDSSLLTGETTPETARPGVKVFAGTLNLANPLQVTTQAVGEGTLLADIVRLMESAEQGRAKYVAVADRVARWYTPVVHSAALLTFLARRDFLRAAVFLCMMPCTAALSTAE